MCTCRFAETEAVAIITLFIARYRIRVKEEPQFASETFDERKERLLRASPTLTLQYVAQARPMLGVRMFIHLHFSPIRAPLVFKRR